MLDIWLDEFRPGRRRRGSRQRPSSRRRGARATSRRRRGPPDGRTRSSSPSSWAARGPSSPTGTGSTDEEFFLACNADNLTDFDLRTLIEFHRTGDGGGDPHPVPCRPDPSACGIVELDDDGRVVGFAEKPSRPVSDLANAGIYAFHPSVLDDVVGEPPLDIGYRPAPQPGGPGAGRRIDGYFRDIGTAEAYRLAQEEWRPRVAP